MRNKFKKEECSCGCGNFFTRWLNPPKPSEFEVTKRTTITDKPLVIKRLTDGEEFRLGDTVELNNATKKNKAKGKLYKIQVEDNGFMQLHAYSLKGNGSYAIRNEEIHLKNADDITNFNLLKKANK